MYGLGFSLVCLLGIAVLHGTAATYSLDDATLAIAELENALSHPKMTSTILQDGFRSEFLYNGSQVLYDNVGSLLFAQIRTLQQFGNYYHLWTGFEDGAFLGYYDKGGTVAGSDTTFYTISWQTSYNHSCDYNVTLPSWKSKLDVPASGLSYPGWPSQRESSMRLKSYCREYFHAEKGNGKRVNSFAGQAYDCRMRGWYFLVKKNPKMQWTGVYIDRTTNEVAIPLCIPLFNATGYTTANPSPQYNSKVLPDSNSLLGVACTGFYLSDISIVLASTFQVRLHQTSNPTQVPTSQPIKLSLLALAPIGLRDQCCVCARAKIWPPHCCFHRIRGRILRLAFENSRVRDQFPRPAAEMEREGAN